MIHVAGVLRACEVELAALRKVLEAARAFDAAVKTDLAEMRRYSSQAPIEMPSNEYDALIIALAEHDAIKGEPT